jgi:hypothetical protein
MHRHGGSRGGRAGAAHRASQQTQRKKSKFAEVPRLIVPTTSMSMKSAPKFSTCRGETGESSRRLRTGSTLRSRFFQAKITAPMVIANRWPCRGRHGRSRKHGQDHEVSHEHRNGREQR